MLSCWGFDIRLIPLPSFDSCCTDYTVKNARSKIYNTHTDKQRDALIVKRMIYPANSDARPFELRGLGID